MNFISHTRAAHEHLSQQPQARPHHISLYWALFFAWNAARFPEALPLDREALMGAAHIGNKDTLTATLRALEDFGLLRYQPSRSAGSSRVVMANYGEQVPPVVGQPKPVGSPSNGVTETAEVPPVVGQPFPQNWGNQSPEVTPVVGKHSLYSKTGTVNSRVNSAAAAQKKRGQVFAGEGLSQAQVLDDTAQPDGAGPAQPTAPKEKVARKRKGVGPQAATIRAAATTGPAANGRRRPAPDVPFSQSAIAGLDAFRAAFDGTEYALADLAFYHALVANWRDKKTGEPPLRKDWVATAKRFMLNDAHDNRLKLAPGAAHANRSGPTDAGIPTTGYRSSRYD